MATQDTTVNDNYIPDESEVQTPQAGGSYRISEGKIQRGRAEENNIEVREKVVGRIKRFGVQSGTNSTTGKPYMFLEADWETAQGLVRVHTNLLDRAGNTAPSAACISFAEGLLQLLPNELSILTARQSFKQNEYGTYSTYANVFHLKPGEQRGTPTRRREWPKNTPFKDMWPVLLADMEKHPLWNVRERDAGDGDSAPTHLSELCKECEAKSWPTPNQAPAAWLGGLAKAANHPQRAKLTDYDDDTWGEIRQKLQGRTECPAFLLEAQKALQSQKGAAVPSQGGFEGL